MDRRHFLGAAMTVSLAPKVAYAQTVKESAWHTLLENVRTEQTTPAMAGAVVKDSKTLCFGAVGYRKVDGDVKVTDHDKFHLGSCTKAMTATLVGLFVQEKKLTWDITLAKAFPDCADVMHADLKDVTLMHLLQHRAGMSVKVPPLGENMFVFHNPKEYPGTPREQRLKYVKTILAEKPETPGKKFEYTNRGYILAGAILERIADLSWEETITKKLFEPLGMKSAGFGPPATKEKVDQPWGHREGKEKHTPVESGPFADNPPFLGPAGRVHCNMADWAQFLQLHLNAIQGKSKLLLAETAKWLHTAGFEGSYGGGWNILKRNWSQSSVLTHGGTNTMNYCDTWLEPKEGFAVCAATNVGGKVGSKACEEVASKAIAKYLLNKE